MINTLLIRHENIDTLPNLFRACEIEKRLFIKYLKPFRLRRGSQWFRTFDTESVSLRGTCKVSSMYIGVSCATEPPSIAEIFNENFSCRYCRRNISAQFFNVLNTLDQFLKYFSTIFLRTDSQL